MTHTLSTQTEGQKEKRMSEGWLKRDSPLTCTHMPENLTHGYKKKSSKNSKKQFVDLKSQSGSRKKLVLLINSVLEDILIYHLRLKENFYYFFFSKKCLKKLQVLTL